MRINNHGGSNNESETTTNSDFGVFAKKWAN
jgi:hypothetical protein